MEMKTTFLLLAIILIGTPSYAKEKRIASPFVRYSLEENVKGLESNEAVFIFEFKNLQEGDENVEFVMSQNNGKNQEHHLTDSKFECKVTPGSYRFIIYINENYFELYSHDLEIGSQEKHIYWVTPLKAGGMIHEVDKPIIYLYPETSQEFKVSVDPVGEMTFTYPATVNTWEGTMHPDGQLEINGEAYRYLFWESKQEFEALNPKTTEGFVIKGSEVVAFLEEKLNQIGFTPSERADFITFWGPKMAQQAQMFITFHQDLDCNAFAELDITPKPDNICRFYMSWGAYEGNIKPSAQSLIPFNRKGFTAIEWGGQELPTIFNSLSL